MHASRESGDGSELSVDLRLAGVAPRTAELVEYALRAVVGVRQVLAVVEPRSLSVPALASGRGSALAPYVCRARAEGRGRSMAGKDWARRRAPDLGEFEELAALAWQRLPREFRALCGDVVIRIEDFADRGGAARACGSRAPST